MVLNAVTGSDATRPTPSRTSSESGDEETIRECQAHFRQRLKLESPDVYLVPPDFGSELLGWWREKRNRQPSTAGSRDAGGSSTELDNRLKRESEDPTPIVRATEHSSRGLKRPFPPPILKQEKSKRSKASPEVSSAASEVESVFSMREQRHGSTSSEIAHSEVQSGGTSPQHVTFKRKSDFVNPIPSNPNLARLLAPDCSNDDSEFLELADATKTRPVEMPTAWEKAHPADKMLFRMGREDQDWKVIARRWTEITGHNDKPRHLKWRYEVIQNTMGLQDLQGIEDFSGAGSTLSADLGVHATLDLNSPLSKLLASGRDRFEKESGVEMSFETAAATRNPEVSESTASVAGHIGKVCDDDDDWIFSAEESQKAALTAKAHQPKSLPEGAFLAWKSVNLGARRL